MSNNLDLIEKLTLGTDNIETVTITVDDAEETVDLRPLSSGELTELQKIEKQPFSIKLAMGADGKVQDAEEISSNKTMDIGMADFTESQAETMYHAVAWSMSIGDIVIPVDTIKGLQNGVPEQIFKEVMRISDIGDLEIIKQFRK